MADSRNIDVSVVIPAKNEADNLPELCREIAAALSARSAEIVVVDDGSTDATVSKLQQLRSTVPYLRVIRHPKSCGQSAAIRTGVMAAHGAVIATLDGDGQNVPADIPELLVAYEAAAAASAPVGMVAGQRRRRHDVWAKRVGSRMANRVRGWALRDNTVDTGCGLKVFGREAFLRLPFFDHMHRFLPALMQREGFAVSFVDVNHRPRQHGTSNYGSFDRLWVGVVDLFGVMWLKRRYRPPGEWDEV